MPANTEPGEVRLREIGRRLQAIRQYKGASQQAMAVQHGTNQSTWNRMEMGSKAILDAALLADVCRLEGFSLEWLIHGDEPRRGSREWEAEALILEPAAA